MNDEGLVSEGWPASPLSRIPCSQPQLHEADNSTPHPPRQTTSPDLTLSSETDPEETGRGAHCSQVSHVSHVSVVQSFLSKLDELQGPAGPLDLAPPASMKIQNIGLAIADTQKRPPDASPATSTGGARHGVGCRKRCRALEDWGSLNQDDAEAHKYMGAAVYHGAANSLRGFMLGKRTRKILRKAQERAGEREAGRDGVQHGPQRTTPSALGLTSCNAEASAPRPALKEAKTMRCRWKR